MPRKQTNNRKNRKTMVRKRRPQKGELFKDYTLVNRGPAFMPDKYICRLKYTDRLTLSAASGTPNHYVFRGNSVFDPDFTSTGHQPVGHDELAAIYTLYRVYASSIKIRYISTVQTSGGVMELAIAPSISSSDYAATDPEVLAQNPYGKFRLVAGDGADGQQLLTHYMTSAKQLGKEYMAGSSSAASGGANPTFQWFWHINTQTVDETTNQSGYLYVSIEYYVEWSGRKVLAES